ncbi:GNAT family N-acetyltransferase [Rhodopseudomonas sp. HC1]|nr:GNAT family N-acetyltransferase [Rhodopseudomonas infernalis]
MNPIETQRLVLRNFRPTDAADLFAYLHAPRASCFLSMKLDDLAAAETEAAKLSASDEHIAVCLKSTGTLIGDLFAVPEDDTVAVGWNFNAAFAGAGFASEAAHALFEDLFTVRGARRLYAYVEDHNIASQRLCARLGMRQEGVFKEFVSFTTDRDGRPIYENTLQFAMLRNEWEQRSSSRHGDGLESVAP